MSIKSLSALFTFVVMVNSTFVKASTRQHLPEQHLQFNNNITVQVSETVTEWFVLPEKHKYHQITLQIPLQNGRIYYPRVKLYDKYKKVTKTIVSPIKMVNLAPYKDGFEVLVPFSPNDVYMTIDTLDNIVGQEFSIDRYQQNIIPITTIDGTVYVPSVNTEHQVKIKFSNMSFISILTPDSRSFNAAVRQDGWFFYLGTKFGGDTVAQNPGGDNYKAGGGAELSIGYDFPSQVEFLSYQLSGGFRYQGAQIGKGSNEALFAKAIVNYEFEQFTVGAGVQADFAIKTTDEFGIETTFDNVIYPFIYTEYKILPRMNITANYSFVEYTTTDGKLFSGDQLGVGIKMFFGKWSL